MLEYLIGGMIGASVFLFGLFYWSLCRMAAEANKWELHE